MYFVVCKTFTVQQNIKWHSSNMGKLSSSVCTWLTLSPALHLSPSPWSFWTFWWRRMNFHSAPPERKMRDIRDSIRAMMVVMLWGWWDGTWGALARAWCCQVNLSRPWNLSKSWLWSGSGIYFGLKASYSLDLPHAPNRRSSSSIIDSSEKSSVSRLSFEFWYSKLKLLTTVSTTLATSYIVHM